MSADQFELNCSVRADSGKGASRRLRRLDNAIPAILYGGNKDPMALTIAHDDILHATENEAFFSHIITLNIGKDKEKAVVK
ncbi:MAG: 50S ribosomal protein L25, partial [Pseudomonadota bacterium]|nr:50S ribosomal protein L25 [Pseudomonadota bacterium]